MQSFILSLFKEIFFQQSYHMGIFIHFRGADN